MRIVIRKNFLKLAWLSCYFPKAKCDLCCCVFFTALANSGRLSRWLTQGQLTGSLERQLQSYGTTVTVSDVPNTCHEDCAIGSSLHPAE